MKSVHGQLLAKGDQNGPALHRLPHRPRDRSPQNGHFKMASDKRCGKCHQDRLLHYRDTYHGKAMALGKPNVASDVAACFDCHGHHDVLPPSNPESRLSKNEYRVAPASSAIPDANARLHRIQAARQPARPEELPAPQRLSCA